MRKLRLCANELNRYSGFSVAVAYDSTLVDSIRGHRSTSRWIKLTSSGERFGDHFRCPAAARPDHPYRAFDAEKFLGRLAPAPFAPVPLDEIT